MLDYEKRLKPLSRSLRNRMTDAERVLWSKLRRKQLKGCQFYRQKIIGPYIVDFYCAAARLVIEVDGGQHYLPEGRARDGVRDAYLEGAGTRVLRLSDREVLEDMSAVLEKIWGFL